MPGSLAGAFAVLLTLNVANPDAFIARTNLARARTGAPLDHHYLTALSADAVPTILEAVGLLSPVERCGVLVGLQDRWGDDERVGQEWNLSRRRAARAVTRTTAAAAACPWAAPVPPAS
ncbi:MAG: DUF4173 domain-containing protein [Gemmatimonadales bacterium]|nr:MAG: DUF4173 domain-containing protein [Gemmatimonadales bacterium]